VRLLWLLPKAAPALLRHIAAYVDLASLDLARAQREITAEVVALAVMALCGLFALFMGCLVVVACTWDTPHRVAAIAWMGGGFLGVAVIAAIIRSKLCASKSPLLSAVREQWQQDRALVERIVSDESS
jgi:uncharacterized membrane protein YqjE